MKYNEIRKSFIDFFTKKGHRFVSSSPLVPYDDPTLLFANAGMNQFKDVFLGTGNREYTRAVNSQKCIRVSGKHNDLEEVGRDTYHHTFFEMLGNWSFGDYYKKEAIEWAWELLTKEWGLPKNKLWATVYKTDEEALNLWKDVTDISREKILKFDEKDNFWEMGDIGPCGPCSEIHIDLTNKGCNSSDINSGNPLVIEIWNLVFIQYDRKSKDELIPLPSKHVDTGMGLDRVCAVIQGKKSNYDSDIFIPLISKISEISKKNYSGEVNQVAMRVIADHIRSLTFAIADGAIPSNEGRGYVMRRILRRASRFARNLDIKEPILHKLVPIVIEHFGDFFNEIKEKQEIIKKVILAEEENFNATLDRGLEIFDEIVNKNVKRNIQRINGDDVFRLYDTYGFPVDLTNLLADEKNLTLDMDGFYRLMDEQINRSRSSGKTFTTAQDETLAIIEQFDFAQIPPTNFVGYEKFETEAQVLDMKTINGKSYILLDKTPFYYESGGQISDTGFIVIDDISYGVIDLLKTGSHIIHIIDTEIQDHIKNVLVKVNSTKRRKIMQNHSATHLLHAALREVLGSHVQQAGSLVDENHLRFDFTHYQKVSDDELTEIENIVNNKIQEAIPRKRHADISQEDAKKMGALAFFGDKYGDKVNVIQFGDYSMEFCGGTHVNNTSDIGYFKILSESSISSGIRRIEAITSGGLHKYICDLNFKLEIKNSEIELLNEKIKNLEKELKKFHLLSQKEHLDSLVKNAKTINGIKILSFKVEVENTDELKSINDMIRSKLGSGIVVIGTILGDKVQLVASVSDDLVKEKKIQAGKLINEIAKIVGGGGGGRPNFATAGGKDINKLEEALKSIESIIKKLL
jgi:alanyl-tRNA synthetase